MKSASIHNREELLFDYMEGNLTEGQRKQVEALLSQDPALKAELMLWNETVVKEELPVSVPVDHLYKPVPFWRKPVISAVLLICILSSITLTFTYLWEGNEKVKVDEKHMISEQPQESAFQKFIPAGDNQADHDLQLKSPQQSAIFQSEDDLVRDESAVTIEESLPESPEPEEQKIAVTVTDSVPGTLFNSSVVFEESGLKKEVSDTVLHSQVSLEKAQAELSKASKLTKEEKKKLRKISRMKRKALERKEQQQFMKGNKPYVVPPDLKNF